MTSWMLTGGAGYIGSHILRELRDQGYQTIVVDDLSTGLAERVPQDVPLLELNVTERQAVAQAMIDHDVAGVIHLAAKKAVGESMRQPSYYYRQNVVGLLELLGAMSDAGVERLIYSSSAAVYGEPHVGTVSEDDATVPLSPYGETKLAGEWLVRDEARARGLGSDAMSFVNLRYFNVAGAGSKLLGDTSVANLIPLVFRALSDGVDPVIFGTDYPTPDGTCIRDYIHVVDLARAHVAAVNACAAAGAGEVASTYNVGRGSGSSVREVMDAVADVTGLALHPRAVARRPGDPAMLVAKADRIAAELGWTAQLDLRTMVASAWEAWSGARRSTRS